MYEYCNRWKLIVNIDKTKVVIFRKGEEFQMILNFYMTIAQSTISGQALKAIFKTFIQIYWAVC